MQKKSIIFSEPFAKMAWLRKQVEKNLFHNVSFQNGWMPLTQVKNHYPFFINEQFDINPDVSKRMIPYLDYIDLKATYEDKKLNQLQSIKQQLLMHDMIHIKDLSQVNIIQLDHGFVPPYLDVNESINLISPVNNSIDCFKCEDTENQIYAIFEKVVSLLNEGIDINQIKILNTTEDDDFQLKKLMTDAGIPLYVNKSRSIRLYPIYQTIKAQFINKGLEQTKSLMLDLKKAHEDVIEPMMHKFNQYTNSTIEASMDIFIHELDQIRIKPTPLQQAVEVLSVAQIKDLNQHYLLMNYIDERFPTKAIDRDYLTDRQKQQIGYPTTDQVNRYRQKSVGHLLNGLDHLTLFYPTKLIDETRPSNLHLSRKMNVIDYQYHVKDISYLKNDDILRYGKLKYQYDQYQILSKDYQILDALLRDKIAWFDHQFKGIHLSDLDQLLKTRFSITGAKIEKLNLCPFQYFLTYLLRLDHVEPNHYIYFGNFIHQALEHLVHDEDFDYVSMVKTSTTFPEDIAYKKDLYQSILIDNIEAIYDLVKDFHAHAKYDQVETEKKISRKIKPSDRFHIKGIIDKLMIDHEKGYYAIVDYKYSGKSFSMKEFEQGLKLQLPFYAYLYQSDKKLKPSGIFFRQTGLNREKSNETMSLKMDGVFLDDENQMLRLDPNANHIKGLRYKNKGGLYKNQSKISEEQFEWMIQTMEKMIVKAAKTIEQGDFKIKPILTIKNNHHSISCQYCPFGQICYSKNKHIKEVSREVYERTT